MPSSLPTLKLQHIPSSSISRKQIIQLATTFANKYTKHSSQINSQHQHLLAMSQPVFVLVPGSFSPPSVYDSLKLILQRSRYESHVVALVSANSEGKFDTPPTMYDDAAAIRIVLARLVDEGKEIILVMSSYGGYPGTEATKGLSKGELKEEGKEGGIVNLVYLAAWMPPLGVSLFQIMEEPMDMKKAVSTTFISVASVHLANWSNREITHTSLLGSIPMCSLNYPRTKHWSGARNSRISPQQSGIMSSLTQDTNIFLRLALYLIKIG